MYILFIFIVAIYTYITQQGGERNKKIVCILFAFLGVIVIAVMLYFCSVKVHAFYSYVYHKCCIVKQEPEEARIAIEDAYNNDNGYATAVGDFFFYIQGDYGKAIHYYDKALSVKPEDPELNFLIGRAYRSRQTEEGDLGDAIRHLEFAVSKHSDKASYNFELAMAYFDNHRYADAENCFKVVIDNTTQKTEKAEGYFWRGRTRVAQYKFDLAVEEDFDKAIDRVKTNEEYYFWRGFAHYQSGTYDAIKAAREDFITAKTLDDINDNSDRYDSYIEAASRKLILGGWGDNDGGRPDYTVDEINAGFLGNQITFNSISDSTIGHEKNFVGARLASTDGLFEPDGIDVEDGETYTIRLFVHNNSPKGEDAIAEEVKATFSLPTTASKMHTIIGYIDCPNAKPTRYWDGVTLLSDDLFYIEYVEGSARYSNNLGTVSILDDVITSGTLLGYDKLDGKIPGCYQYDGVVAIEVKVHKAIAAWLSVVARLKGSTEWMEVVNAKIGDEVEYQIEYVNLLSETVNDVAIRDILPTNVRYVEGSTMLYNSNYPDGVLLKDNDRTVTTTGINVGSYLSKGNAYVRFTGRIVDNTLAEGANRLVNWANVTINGMVYNDDVSIMVDKRQ